MILKTDSFLFPPSQVTEEKLVSVDSVGQVRVWDFSLPLMKIGAGAEEEITIEHNVAEEAELLKPKPPPTPETRQSKRKRKKKRRKEEKE